MNKPLKIENGKIGQRGVNETLLANQFSFSEINDVTTINSDQQMIVKDSISIISTLFIFGYLVLIDFSKTEIIYPDNFSYSKIENDKHVEVPLNQEMVLANRIDILGELKLLGNLSFVDSNTEIEDNYLPSFEILTYEKIKIPLRKEYRVVDLLLFGQIEVFGRLTIGA